MDVEVCSLHYSSIASYKVHMYSSSCTHWALSHLLPQCMHASLQGVVWYIWCVTSPYFWHIVLVPHYQTPVFFRWVCLVRHFTFHILVWPFWTLNHWKRLRNVVLDNIMWAHKRSGRYLLNCQKTESSEPKAGDINEDHRNYSGVSKRSVYTPTNQNPIWNGFRINPKF